MYVYIIYIYIYNNSQNARGRSRRHVLRTRGIQNYPEETVNPRRMKKRIPLSFSYLHSTPL